MYYFVFVVYLEKIGRHMKFIIEKLEVQFGLYDSLKQRQVLDPWNLEKILKCKNMRMTQNRKLCKILEQQNSEELCARFVLLLKETQRHLYNYISKDGSMHLLYLALDCDSLNFVVIFGFLLFLY